MVIHRQKYIEKYGTYFVYFMFVEQNVCDLKKILAVSNNGIFMRDDAIEYNYSLKVGMC